jgi:hypothetical protein
MKQNNISPISGGLSRRQFIKLAAAAGLLAGCNSIQKSGVVPTSSAKVPAEPADVISQKSGVAPTSPATVPAEPTQALASVPVTAEPLDVIKFYPDVPSKVVQTHHAGVWDGERLSPEAIRQMLDASITELTGLNDSREAWGALFKPGEKVAIKVNTFNNSTIWTHAPLVNAVVASLQEAGLPPDQIFIYDHLTMFKEAGYEVNESGPGVRCFEETDFTGQWEVASSTVSLSSTLQDCDALINMPVLKSHMLAGLTFALKNHYGTVEYPSSLHYPIDQAIAGLNALPPIKDRTRLIIGDILEANLRYSNLWPYWSPDWKGDSLLMSFDPVAHDTVGMQILEQLQAENEVTLSSALRDLATSYLTVAAELNLGTNDPEQIETVEVKLG